MGHEVRVRIREIGYRERGEDDLGNTVMLTKSAYGPGHPNLANSDPDTQRLGQLIELDDEAYMRHKAHGNVLDADEAEEVLERQEEEEINVRDADAAELASWIEEEKPTVNEVVQASEGNADYARKLLDAETQAQGGEPRKGVVDGLSAVIGRGE